MNDRSVVAGRNGGRGDCAGLLVNVALSLEISIELSMCQISMLEFGGPISNVNVFSVSATVAFNPE